MDASIVVAVIALVGAILSGTLSLWGQLRSAKLTARREAEAVLARYREPLISAAYELQGRLYNILELGFLGEYCGREHALRGPDDPVLGRPFLLWRGEQRAIGECMIDREDGDANCLGYASFLKHRGSPVRRWLARLVEADIAEATHERSPRLVGLQQGLVDLIRELDPEQIRYAEDELQRCHLAATPA